MFRNVPGCSMFQVLSTPQFVAYSIDLSQNGGKLLIFIERRQSSNRMVGGPPDPRSLAGDNGDLTQPLFRDLTHI